MSEHSVHLKMTPEAAQVTTDALVTALYGGKWPEGGRQCLLAVSDALHEALAPLTSTRNMAIVRDWPLPELATTNGESPSRTQGSAPSDTQGEGATI